SRTLSHAAGFGSSPSCWTMVRVTPPPECQSVSARNWRSPPPTNARATAANAAQRMLSISGPPSAPAPFYDPLRPPFIPLIRQSAGESLKSSGARRRLPCPQRTDLDVPVLDAGGVILQADVASQRRVLEVRHVLEFAGGDPAVPVVAAEL